MPLALFILLCACAAKQPVYKTYNNARFNYSISYPPDELIPQGEPEDGDGQRFLSKDGRVIVWVYGSYDALNQTLRDIQQSEIERFKGLEGSFKTLKAQVDSTSSILEGDSDTNVYYEKVIFSRNTIFTFIAQYPKDEAPTFEPIISRMAASFIVFPKAQ